MPLVPFKDRLRELIEQHGLTQAKLADLAGVDRSTITRLVKGDRAPTMETLGYIAPVFKMKIPDMVNGTDAQARLTEGAAMVRRQDYDEAVKKMVEFELKVTDLERKLRSTETALASGQQDRAKNNADLCMLQFKWETAERDLQAERDRTAELNQDLRRHRDALRHAVGDVSSLRGQLEELAQELKDAAKSGRTTSILAGVAALAGVVTMASYLASDDTRKARPQGE